MALLRNSTIFFLLITLCVFVFNDTAYTQVVPPCWAMQFDGNEPSWPGRANPDITSSVSVSDGYVVCGTSHNMIFPSKDHKSFGRTTFGGPYVAKYDFDGNLQWVDYGIDPNYHLLNDYVTIRSVTADENDNLYISGYFFPNFEFYYDGGKSKVKLSSHDQTVTVPYGHKYFVAKLDPDGKVLWHTSLSDDPYVMKYDNVGRLTVTGRIKYQISEYVNKTDTTRTFTQNPSDWKYHFFLYWIDTANGDIVQYMPYSGPDYTVEYFDLLMTTDRVGNVVICSQFDEYLRFFSPSLNDSIVRTDYYKGINIQNKMFVAKVNSAGIPMWIAHDGQTSKYPANESFPHYLIENKGSIYLSSYCYPDSRLDSYVYYNPDSSYYKLKYEHNRIYKINSDGFLEWESGPGGNNSLGLSVLNNRIYFAGYNLNNTKPRKDTFYSSEKNVSVVKQNNSPELFFASYDTLGNPLSVSKYGKSNGPIFYQFGNVIPLNNNSLLMSCWANRQASADSLVMFYDIVKFNNRDAFMVKYTPGSCDSLIVPDSPFYIFVDESSLPAVLCSGADIDIFDSLSGLVPLNLSWEVFLSDSTGSFLSSTLIGTGGTAGKNMIRCTIPNLANGGNYKLMIKSNYGNSVPTIKSLSIHESVTTSVSISATPYPDVQKNTKVEFIASVFNQGATPYLQWYVNSTPVPNANFLSYQINTLKNSDTVWLLMNSSKICASPDTVFSNKIIATIRSEHDNDINNNNIPIDLISNDTTIQIVRNTSVYPNPNNGIFTVNVYKPNADAVSLRLSSIYGADIFRREYPIEAGKEVFELQLAIGDIVAAGIYILEVSVGSEIMKFRVVIV